MKRLLAWQWFHYNAGHKDRANLLVHLLTAPLFVAGTCAIASVSFGTHPAWAGGGLAAMIFAVALQGRGHTREAGRPQPFRGPFDAIARLFLEQWVTFPRYVLTGAFARAWRRR